MTDSVYDQERDMWHGWLIFILKPYTLPYIIKTRCSQLQNMLELWFNRTKQEFEIRYVMQDLFRKQTWRIFYKTESLHKNVFLKI